MARAQPRMAWWGRCQVHAASARAQALQAGRGEAGVCPEKCWAAWRPRQQRPRCTGNDCWTWWPSHVARPRQGGAAGRAGLRRRVGTLARRMANGNAGSWSRSCKRCSRQGGRRRRRGGRGWAVRVGTAPVPEPDKPKPSGSEVSVAKAAPAANKAPAGLPSARGEAVFRRHVGGTRVG